MDYIGTTQIGCTLGILKHESGILGEVCEHVGSLLKSQVKVASISTTIEIYEKYTENILKYCAKKPV